MRLARWAGLASLVLTSVMNVSAQTPIPVYAFVQDSTGQIWIIGKTARVAIPLLAATDDQIAGIPWNGQWMIPTSAGIGPGSKPSWAGADPTLPSGAATTDVSPVATSTTTAEDLVKLNGDRALNTKPFDLHGGNYSVTWEIKLRRDDSSCFGNGYLRRVDGQRGGGSLYAAVLRSDGDRSASGETQVYGTGGGQYYVEAAGGCTWSVTISPQ